MWQFWLIIAGLCFVIESFTIVFFVFWFGIGALVALITTFFIGNIFIQASIFIITSTILLILTKPLVKKFVKTVDATPTNVNSLIGKEGIVLEDINSIDLNGKVKVNGELWSAISDTDIEKGSKIKVVDISGVKVKVEKILMTK
jgi:membrane protein implicated in regulation of membrane protease activity